MMWWLIAERLPFGTVGKFIFWFVLLVVVIHWLGGVPV